MKLPFLVLCLVWYPTGPVSMGGSHDADREVVGIVRGCVRIFLGQIEAGS